MRMLPVALAAMVAVSGGCGSNGSDAAHDARAGAPGASNDGTGGGGATPVGASSSGEADAGAPGEPAPPPKVDVTTETVQVGASARTFVLASPKGYDPARTYPLVLVFHGDGGNGAGMRAAYRFDDHSAADAFVAYPDGKNAGWDLYTPEAENEDDAFVVAIVQDLTARFSIDASRAFGIGYSSGAFFIEQVACRKSTLFRGIVPNAGGAPNEPNDANASFWKPYYTRCANQSGGVAAMIMHGTNDPVVEPESGDFSAQYWAYVNGCDDQKETRTAASPAPCLAHANCPAGKPVLYCPIPNIGHGWWADSAKSAWAFFQGL